MANTAIATILQGDISLRKGYRRYRTKLDRNRFDRKLNNFQHYK